MHGATSPVMCTPLFLSALSVLKSAFGSSSANQEDADETKFTCLISNLHFLKTLKYVHEDFRTNDLKVISVSGDRNVPVL